MFLEIYKSPLVLPHLGRILLSLLLVWSFGSCKKYLDLKPDQTLELPSTLEDCQALLDNYLIMNTSFPTSEMVADNYYLTYADWNTLSILDHAGYTWQADADVNQGIWLSNYEKVLYANQVLATLDGISGDSSSLAAPIKGEALFFRGFTFYMLAQLWAQPYKTATAKSDLGIPLRLSPAITGTTTRATIQQTYDQMLGDLKQAATLLSDIPPTSNITKTRPSKAAAYAALARVYLAMGDYINAAVTADSCLQNYNTLMDYTQLDSTSNHPIAIFNPEVLFQADTYSALALNASKGKVDTNLYASYDSNDLRKVIFFRQNTGANTGTYQFKGSYEGGGSILQFCGLATDEVYLTRAECYARVGNTAAAMADLNTLLQTRWVMGTYTYRTALNADDALSQILVERRKELLFRSLRWTDLRRLNQEARFASTLIRVLNGTTYTLPPNDLRYTLLIPSEVLRREPMPQNPR